MTSATCALLLLLVSGAVGVLGLWQLLAGDEPQRAELAERGPGRRGRRRPGATCCSRWTSASAAPTAGAGWAPGSRAPGVRLPAVELIGLRDRWRRCVGWFVLSLLVARRAGAVVGRDRRRRSWSPAR